MPAVASLSPISSRAHNLFDKIPYWEKQKQKRKKEKSKSSFRMYVVKRDGRQEAVHFDKITARLKKLSYGLSTEHCDPVLVSQKVCAGVYKGVTTSQLDELAAETAAAMTTNHPDYASVSVFLYLGFVLWGSFWFFKIWVFIYLSGFKWIWLPGFVSICLFYVVLNSLIQLAARIAVSNLHKNTKKSFSET